MSQISIDFHHSTSKDPLELFKETVSATAQTWKIWQLMKDGRKRTSIEVAAALDLNLNSARRALTDLTKKFKLLRKLEETKVEAFGKPNHYYQKIG